MNRPPGFLRAILISAVLLASIVVVGEAPFQPTVNAAPAMQGTPYTITDLGDLGCGASEALAISDSGRVVGYSTTTCGVEHAVFFNPTNEGPRDLGGLPGAGASRALGIQGINIVGQSYTVVSGVTTTHGFVYDNSIHDLGTLSSNQTRSSSANGVNSSGVIAGTSDTNAPGVHAFRCPTGTSGGGTPCTMQDLGPPDDSSNCVASIGNAINTGGQVAGYFSYSGPQGCTGTAAVYSGSWMALPPLSGIVGDQGQAYALNDSGVVVGQSDPSHFCSCGRAVRWKDGAVLELAAEGGIARGVNNNGVIVG